MSHSYEIKCDNFSVSHYSDGGFATSLSGDHCHDSYEITFLLSGAGSFLVEGTEYSLCHGSLIFINPAQFHKVSFCSDEDLEVFTLYFNSTALSPEIMGLIRSKPLVNEHGVFYSVGIIGETLANVFDRFSVGERLPKEERALYMQTLLSEIILLLSSAGSERLEKSELELGARVAKYLNSNIEKPLCLDKLARRFFVSKYYLCRAFKSYSGISPHAYIVKKRIIYAKQLIDSGVTAAAAAERVGFGDYSAFYRAYVRLFGKAPTQ